jgi:hypothetical protein
MKTIKIAYLHQKQAEEPAQSQAQQLLQLIKLYREQEEAYYSKLKFNQFAGSEKEVMMQTRKKLDNLIYTINLKQLKLCQTLNLLTVLQKQI